MDETHKHNHAAGDIEMQIGAIRDDISRLTQHIAEFAGRTASDPKNAARSGAEDFVERTRETAAAATENARHAAGSV